MITLIKSVGIKFGLVPAEEVSMCTMQDII